MHTRSKVLSLALLVLTACGLTLAYSKGLFMNKRDQGDENNRKAVNGVKYPVPAIKSASSARDQGSTGVVTVSNQSFTGRAIKNEEALELADTVVVGRIIDLGERDFGAAGQLYYGNVKIEITETIKGSPSTKVTTVALTVQKIPAQSFEETPKKGDKYILFVKKLNPKALRATKLIEATEENVNKIRALAQSPVNKS